MQTCNHITKQSFKISELGICTLMHSLESDSFSSKKSCLIKIIPALPVTATHINTLIMSKSQIPNEQRYYFQFFIHVLINSSGKTYKKQNLSVCFHLASFKVYDDQTINSHSIVAGGQVYNKMNMTFHPTENKEEYLNGRSMAPKSFLKTC